MEKPICKNSRNSICSVRRYYFKKKYLWDVRKSDVKTIVQSYKVIYGVLENIYDQYIYEGGAMPEGGATND